MSTEVEGKVEDNTQVEEGKAVEETKEAPVEGKSAPTEGEPPVFTPNFKVKVMDDEYEVDEWLRPTVTDAEKEKRVRELYEKAYAMDHYKSKHSELSDAHTQASERLDKFETFAQSLRTAVDSGDLDTVNQLLGMDEQKLWSYVKKRLDYLEMSPEQRSDYDARRGKEIEALQARNELQTMRTQYQQQLWNMKNFEIQQVMSRPDVVAAAREIDTRLGQKGAFLARVVQEGQTEFARTKNDLSAAEAVDRVLKLAGYKAPEEGAASGTPLESTTKREVKTLPNIKGTGNSPVKKKITSIEQIKARARQMAGT